MPINYLPQQIDPLQRALQGLQIGSTIQGIRARSAAADEAERAKLAAVETKKQYNIDLEETFANPTPTAFARLTTKYPQQREAFKQSLSMLTGEQRENELAVTGQVYSALQAGNNEAALSIVDNQIEALQNSGKNTEKLELFRNNMVEDPDNAKGYAGLLLSSVMGAKDFAKTFETLGKEARETELQTGVIKKQAADLELTKAQTNKAIIQGEKIGHESTKALLELQALENAGGVDPAKKFDQEEKIIKEYSSKTKEYQDSRTTLEKIKSSAADNSGAGDLALVFSFMKMLDPGSVVRESEFAAASDTAGLYANLKNQATKVQSGQFLTPKQRKQFASLANQYMTAASKHEKRVKKSLDSVIKNYKLNPDNIFGAVEEVVEAIEEAPAGKSYMKFAKVK